jgi:hypothetical protein
MTGDARVEVEVLFCKRKTRIRLDKKKYFFSKTITNHTYCPALSIPIDLRIPSLSSGIISISTSFALNNLAYSVASS